jgi:hypothetical protein
MGVGTGEGKTETYEGGARRVESFTAVIGGVLAGVVVLAAGL